MKNRNSSQKGSALVYILIAIALLAALTATFMDSSSQQTSSQNTFNTVTDLNSQINFIRSAVQECVLTYPGGDATPAFAATNASNTPYPINPSSTYLASPATPPGNDRAEFLRCPGNPGDSNDHATIFGGSSGKFMPPPPKLFNPWIYYSGLDGVFFYNSTSMTDAYLSSALLKLDDQFSECEADVISNVAGGAPLSIATASAATCPEYSLCFRVWLISQPTANYAGDLDNDEAACP
jgi:hypothetical protein